MTETLEILKKNEIFRTIPEEIIQEKILPHGQRQDITRGQFLITPQQYVDSFSVVLSGRIQMMHIFVDGNYDLINVLSPGKTLGADLICTRSRLSPYYAAAAVPTQLLSFSADLILQPGLIDEAFRLEMLNHLLMLISHENIKREYRLAILSQKGLRDRILTYLTMQAAKRQTDTFSIPFSRDELASFLCVNRSALSHELSLMQQEGLISFRKNSFSLKNIPKI